MRRDYDPVIGRFQAIDPMVDKYGSWTPYNFAFNDPIGINDPLGADGESHQTGPDLPNYYFAPPSHTADYYQDEYNRANSDGYITPGEERWLSIIYDSGAPSDPGLRQQYDNFVQGERYATALEQWSKPKYNIYLQWMEYGMVDPKTKKHIPTHTGKYEIVIEEDKHAEELNKYGYVTSGVNLSGTLSLGAGGTIEYGWIVTNKNWAQYYYTVFYTSTAAAGVGGNLMRVVNKGKNKTTFSDWAGPVFGGSVNYLNGSGQFGTSTTYNVYGGGPGLGLSFKLFGAGSIGYTYLIGAPINLNPKTNMFIKNTVNTMNHQ